MQRISRVTTPPGISTWWHWTRSAEGTHMSWNRLDWHRHTSHIDITSNYIITPSLSLLHQYCVIEFRPEKNLAKQIQLAKPLSCSILVAAVDDNRGDDNNFYWKIEKGKEERLVDETRTGQEDVQLSTPQCLLVGTPQHKNNNNNNKPATVFGCQPRHIVEGSKQIVGAGAGNHNRDKQFGRMRHGWDKQTKASKLILRACVAVIYRRRR